MGCHALLFSTTLFIQQVGHVAELSRGMLKSFNLLPQLSLLSLLLTQDFVNILH